MRRSLERPGVFWPFRGKESALATLGNPKTRDSEFYLGRVVWVKESALAALGNLNEFSLGRV